jgi:hypothetical protein
MSNPRYAGLEHIVAIGGPGDGTGWTLPVEVVVERINSGAEAFFVHVDNAEVDIEVVQASGLRRAYIKTKPDYTTKDNLLSLPPCPAK